MESLPLRLARRGGISLVNPEFGLRARKSSSKPSAVKQKSSSNFSSIRLGHLLRQKFPFLFSRRCAYMAVSRLHRRGASRSSRTWEAGCDGRIVLRDEQHEADGEVVWSWRRDAGAKLPGTTIPRGDGGKKARSPRRARIRRNPSRGECRLFRLNLW